MVVKSQPLTRKVSNMTPFEIFDKFCALQREMLITATRTTNLVWRQNVEFADLLVKINPYVPESGKKLMTGFLGSYLSFMDKRRNLAEIMNGMSKDIMARVAKSMYTKKERDSESDISKQVLDLVKNE